MTLEKAQPMPPDGMKLYIIIHRHRRGDDIWPVFSPELPCGEEIINKLRSQDDWGEADEDALRNWPPCALEIRGPFAWDEIESLQKQDPRGQH